MIRDFPPQFAWACTIGFCTALTASIDGTAATIVVDPSGDGDFTEIQPAVDATADGDTVLVRPGEYIIREPIDFNRLHDPGDPQSPRVKNIVVRAQGTAEATVIRPSEDWTDSERHGLVVFENGESEASVLEGFTFTGGTRSGVGCFNGSSPRIVRCTISGNKAEIGAGVYCDHASIQLTDCTITENWAQDGRGGGVYCVRSTLTITGSTIANNTAWDGPGGGLYSTHSTLTITGSTIAKNKAWEASGGGMYCHNSTLTITDCAVVDNATDDNEGSGGGICCSGSSPTITNCTISRNIAQDDGGGMFCTEGAAPRLTNCVITGNLSLEYGGGMCCLNESSPELRNCTVAGNRAWQDGGIQISGDSTLKLLFSVVWENTSESLSIGNRSRVDVAYSCVDSEAVLPGPGNINADPLFCQPGHWTSLPDLPSIVLEDDVWTGGDYRLRAASPCLGLDGGTEQMGADLGLCDLPSVRFKRSDTNGDGDSNIADAVFVLIYLFRGAEEPSCHKAADVDDNGKLELTDAVYELRFLFLGGPAPKDPFLECGRDTTVDDLSCRSSPSCVE